MYQEHEMNIIAFNSVEVFTDLSLASDADEEGGGSSKHSWGSERSDS